MLAIILILTQDQELQEPITSGVRDRCGTSKVEQLKFRNKTERVHISPIIFNRVIGDLFMLF